MRNTLIIGLTGPKGVGKSTTARALWENFESKEDYHPYRVSFAGVLDTVLCTVFGSLPSNEDKEKPWVYGKSLRDLKKSFGTAWGREMVNTEIWVDYLLGKIQQVVSNNDRGGLVFIIDDLRMPNEYEALRQYAGRDFVRIELERDGVDYTGDHATERGIELQAGDMICDLDQGTPEEVAAAILDGIDRKYLLDGPVPDPVDPLDDLVASMLALDENHLRGLFSMMATGKKPERMDSPRAPLGVVNKHDGYCSKGCCGGDPDVATPSGTVRQPLVGVTRL